MSLTPSNEGITFYVDDTTIETVAPTKTYFFDFEKGELTNFEIDGDLATKQFIQKAVKTVRFKHICYDDQYGCEVENLIGVNYPIDFLRSEVPRVIKEALMYDDRISNVHTFSVELEDDKLLVEFTVDLFNGNSLREGVSVIV